ncbi:response regulator [Aliishimia ponticola]|uniref:Response regulator n=1 Tax=Aliishimia ponticola TaxID=2499833 RepID=A0A4S4NB36_9RHOB|nr:response regulator [Aliishimia ponticola]THH36572.1 response regulator [Aliishimia ponticola]
MDDNDTLSLFTRPPTAARPLLGLTVLVVEDSRFASEALRLLCLRSGARIRRADCLRSAHRHLQVYRPTVAIIDIGLRDGSGAELIREMNASQPRTEVILGMSGDPDGEAMAMSAGADGFLAKPVTSLGGFQETILSLLPLDRRPNGPRSISNDEIIPDPIAYQDDLAHMADIMDTGVDEQTMDYVAQFLAGVARSADDDAMLAAVEQLTRKRAVGGSTGSELAQLAGLVQQRLERKIAM